MSFLSCDISFELYPTPDRISSVCCPSKGAGDFIEAASAVLNLNEQKLQSINTVVSFPRITIRDRIRTILNLLQEGKQLIFGNIPRENSRIERVVSFLAMLELIKRNIVQAYQQSLFGDIVLETTGSWDESQDMEIEFKD